MHQRHSHGEIWMFQIQNLSSLIQAANGSVGTLTSRVNTAMLIYNTANSTRMQAQGIISGPFQVRKFTKYMQW